MEETMNLTIIFLRPTARVVGSGMAECRPGMVPFWSRLSTRSLVLPPLFKCETSRGLFIAVWFHTMFWLLFWDDHIFTLTHMFHMVRPPFFSDRKIRWNRLQTSSWWLPPGSLPLRRKFRRDTNLMDPPMAQKKKKQRWKHPTEEKIAISNNESFMYVNVGLFSNLEVADVIIFDAMTTKKKWVILCYHMLPIFVGKKICSRVGSALCHCGGISTFANLKSTTFSLSLSPPACWGGWFEFGKSILQGFEFVSVGSPGRNSLFLVAFFGLEVGPGPSETMVITWAIF